MAIVNELNYGNNKLTYKTNDENNITKIIIIFNKNNEIQNINISNGIVICSIQNSNDLREISTLLIMFLQKITPNNKFNINTNFTFIVNNKFEEEQIQKLISDLKKNNLNNIQMNYSEEYNKNKQIEETNKQQPIIEPSSELTAAGGSKEIIKQDPTGKIEKFIVTDGKIYDNNANLSLHEQANNLITEWQKDPVSSGIAGLTQAELEKKALETLTIGLTTHYFESPSQTSEEKDEKANIAAEQAQKYDGQVTDLGFVQKGADTYSTGNEFVSVEENNNGFYIAEPTINENTITSTNQGVTNNYSNLNSSSSSAYNYNSENNTQLETEEISQREVYDQYTYYVDENDYIYSQENDIEPIGRNNDEQGYYIDEYNNIYKNNEPLGQVEKKQKTKPKTRTLTPPPPNGYINFLQFSIIVSLLLIIYMLITLI